MALRKRGDVIAKKATTIAIVNQKGGTAKTTTCENLGIGLAMEGKKVLLVDVDPQGSLTISMGWQQPDELSTTLSTLMQKAMNDQPVQPGEGILHHAEGVDLIPANIELAGMEVALVNSMNREKMLKQVLDSAKREYDYILLDCTPSLGMLTVNALAAADTTLIPMQAQYLSAKGLEQLLQTIGKVRRQINPKLKIEGILLTMTDSRTIYGQQISNLIRQGYGKHLKVFEQTIPRSVRAAEISTTGKSIYQHGGKITLNLAVSVDQKQLLDILLNVGIVRPVFIWGAPGIGKSAIVEQFAADMGLPCVSLLGSQLAPEDIIGVPQIVNGRSVFCPPKMIAREEPYCLFLDELNAETLDSGAEGLIRALCGSPISKGSSIRIMPDVHAGKGCAVGTTMTIKDCVAPGLVGVDIGCGMLAVKFHAKRLELQKLDKLMPKLTICGFLLWRLLISAMRWLLHGSKTRMNIQRAKQKRSLSKFSIIKRSL